MTEITDPGVVRYVSELCLTAAGQVAARPAGRGPADGSPAVSGPAGSDPAGSGPAGSGPFNAAPGESAAQTPSPAEVLDRLERTAREAGIPIMDRATLGLVTTCLKLKSSRKILEIGTAIGYSATYLALHLPQAAITSLEIDPAKAARAMAHFADAGVADRVQCRCGDALELLPRVRETYDAIVIDAAKGQYSRYLELCLPILAPGGIVFSDNVLFRGMVAWKDEDIPRECRSLVRRLREFNRMLAEHPLLETVFVPVGDGLAISMLRREARQA